MYPLLILALGLVVFALSILFRKKTKTSRTTWTPAPVKKKIDLEPLDDPYQSIEPLSQFNWQTTEPLKIRPFKPKFHLTMALETTGISDLVAIDKTYLERINIRRKLLATVPEEVVAANPIITPTVQEFYEWIFGVYLPSRFPTMFAVEPSSEKGGLNFHNLVTDEKVPIAAPSDAVACLRTIGAHVDDDFLFLLPDPTQDNKYTLFGFITCFPSGFDTRTKLNLKLVDIHGPVPSYKSKLEMSMDRFFATVPSGKVVKRHNWTITTHTDLHTMGGNHFDANEDLEEARNAVNLEQTVLRTERQTLHRLWKSKALCFAFKTYQYKLEDVRDEGSGDELADAIDGLGNGSVPEMVAYKRAAVWAEKVTDFLRGGAV